MRRFMVVARIVCGMLNKHHVVKHHVLRHQCRIHTWHQVAGTLCFTVGSRLQVGLNPPSSMAVNDWSGAS